jgi:uncharacterized protein YutE (UPF0331/DUF86 family)
VSPLDLDVLAEKSMAVERHLARVKERLPDDPAALLASTDASDAVILHLWQATQVVIDLAIAACLYLRLGAASSYADAFRRLQAAGVLDEALGDRLVRAAGFRNLVAHAYDTLDLARVHRAATEGPDDLRIFLARLRDLLTGRRPPSA